MKPVPLGPKRAKLLNHHYGRQDYFQKEKVASKVDEIIQQEERTKK